MLELSPRDLGIILTYRCHSGCAHCLYNCGPRWPNEAMSTADLRQALEAVAQWPHRPQIHLTGGEPFLHFDLLVEGARIASDLGIRAYVETSAAWCTDEAEAVERFNRLRQAGLQFVLVSCSPFHAERIPPARTLRAVGAALEVFGSHRVTVYRSEFLDVVRQFWLERPTPLSRYEELLGAEEAWRLLWQGYGIISGGRAGYRLGHLVPGRPAEAFRGVECSGELLYAHHSHFDLHGNYIPAFCGGLALGSWRDLPQLRQDVRAGRYPSLIQVLIEQGPYGLCQLAQTRHDYQVLADGYTGKCHLCVDVRRHLLTVGEFAELRPRGFYEQL
jgi:glutaredoxin-related protein